MMNINTKSILYILSLILITSGCSNKLLKFSKGDLNVVNREITSIENDAKALSLSAKQGDGYAILKGVDFQSGTIDLEIRGENNPGRSFVGIAFNIQNDTTYEALYFRPFNFQSTEKIRREHSIQYISQPKNTWNYLRTNFEGQFESEYNRQPSPDEWFRVRIKIEEEMISVYDGETEMKMLTVKRLEKSKSRNIALWTGNNSKGSYRNLKITK